MNCSPIDLREAASSGTVEKRSGEPVMPST